MLPKPYRVSVVVQTHWDREWYFPQQQFAGRLLAVMERVCDQLDDGRLPCFLFDGQVAALEDLLQEAEPELADRVLAHAKAGRLLLGPWYVMADEFLVSGESLWRNLEIGMAAAAAYGNCQPGGGHVGYLPDSFGHVAQMPQLLRQHGIASSVTWRGIDLRHAEFRWVAPDGSAVDALYLTQGYYQHPLNLPDWQGALTRYLESIAPRSLSGKLLLTQGGDHLAPHSLLAERIAAFNASQDRYELVLESLQAHLDAIGAVDRPALHGELRDNAQSFVLPDVLSTRRHLKDAHQRLEDRLLGETEPLWAWLQDVEPPARALAQSWKLLLQQQAHDSICGCSVDEVHAEMEIRFAQLAQRLSSLRGRALQAAGLQTPMQHEANGKGAGASVFADERQFTLFNPLPLARSGWQAVELFLQGPQPAAVRVLDEQGNPLPLHWLDLQPHRELRSPLDDFPEPVIGHRLGLRLALPLPGMATQCLRLEACDADAAGAALMTEASELKLPFCLDAGSGQLQGDEQGRLFWQTAAGRLQLLLHTELDAGDSYNFSPPAQPDRQWHASLQPRALRRSGPFTWVELDYRYEQARSLSDDRQGPHERRLTVRGSLSLLLCEGQPWVEAKLRHFGFAEDQRTRLVLAAGETLSEAAGDTAFHWTKRPVRLADYPAQATKQVETPVVVNPSLSAVQAGSISVAHRGLQEFEIVRAPDGSHALALTLQRAVGWLSRRDLVSRGAGAGPDLATPGAQQAFHGETPFAFALDASLDAADLLQTSLLRRRPLLVLPGHQASAWREPLTLPHPKLIPSSLRRVGKELELRVWNALDEALPCALPSWTRTDEGGEQLAPHRIATFRKAIA